LIPSAKGIAMFTRRERSPLSTLRAERIALIKPSALGDIVHTLPVLEALRYRFPQAKITWIVNRSFESLIQNHPDLDDTLPFDRNAFQGGFRRSFRLLMDFTHELRKRRFDLAIDMQGLLRSGLMTLFTGARRRVGFSIGREGSRYCYTDLIPTPPLREQHAVDRNWLVAEAFGVGDFPKRFTVPISSNAKDWAKNELRKRPKPWIVYGVGARWLTKRWLPEHFAVLAKRSHQRFGGTAIFIGALDECELSQQVIDKLSGEVADYTGKTSLPQLAALLEKADVMVANDTGPLHLAAALGCPVIAPYTCTQVRLHGPFGVSRGAIESSIWCAGSYLKKCDRLDCMNELHPDRLWYFLHEVLMKWESRFRSA
jgi:heptosyltransferase I